MMRLTLFPLLCGGLLLSPSLAAADPIYTNCGPRGTGVIFVDSNKVCIYKPLEAKATPQGSQAGNTTTSEQQNVTISEEQLEICRRVIKNRLKDPDSYKEWSAFREEGGLIDYTATNSMGGPTREIIRCTSEFPSLLKK